jgi:acetoin utilization deacetylase AcuC-like enzyme
VLGDNPVKVIAYYADHFVLPLPEGHRFPINKYHLLRKRIRNSDLDNYLELRVPPPATNQQLGRVHTSEYVQRIISGQLSDKEIRRTGFPWSPELVERSRRSVGGTIAAAKSAIRYGLAINLAGGTHHAYQDHGEGFCVFNDVSVAIREVQALGLIQNFLIIDCDVHQGNGTAVIFKNDPSVYTFSIHGVRNFPYHKEQSNLDIALADGTGDQEYHAALSSGIDRALSEFKAEMVFYLAGADPYRDDRLGRLSLTKEGLATRDRIVMNKIRKLRVPTTIVMSGGYSREVQDTVDIHFQTISIYVKELTIDNLQSRSQ